MSLEYSRSVLRVAVAQICQSLGWNSCQASALELLTDVLERYLIQTGMFTHRYTEQFGRTTPNLDDLGLAFQQMGINIAELADYEKHSEPVPFVKEIPKFPVPKQNNLGIPKPNSRELLERPEHIDEHYPSMHPGWEEEIVPQTPVAISPRVLGSFPFSSPPPVTGEGSGLNLPDKQRPFSSPDNNLTPKRPRVLPDEAMPSAYKLKGVSLTDSGFIMGRGVLPESNPPPPPTPSTPALTAPPLVKPSFPEPMETESPLHSPTTKEPVKQELPETPVSILGRRSPSREGHRRGRSPKGFRGRGRHKKSPRRISQSSSIASPRTPQTPLSPDTKARSPASSRSPSTTREVPIPRPVGRPPKSPITSPKSPRPVGRPPKSPGRLPKSPGRPPKSPGRPPGRPPKLHRSPGRPPKSPRGFGAVRSPGRPPKSPGRPPKSPGSGRPPGRPRKPGRPAKVRESISISTDSPTDASQESALDNTQDSILFSDQDVPAPVSEKSEHKQARLQGYDDAIDSVLANLPPSPEKRPNDDKSSKKDPEKKRERRISVNARERRVSISEKTSADYDDAINSVVLGGADEVLSPTPIPESEIIIEECNITEGAEVVVKSEPEPNISEVKEIQEPVHTQEEKVKDPIDLSTREEVVGSEMSSPPLSQSQSSVTKEKKKKDKKKEKKDKKKSKEKKEKKLAQLELDTSNVPSSQESLTSPVSHKEAPTDLDIKREVEMKNEPISSPNKSPLKSPVHAVYASSVVSSPSTGSEQTVQPIRIGLVKGEGSSMKSPSGEDKSEEKHKKKEKKKKKNKDKDKDREKDKEKKKDKHDKEHRDKDKDKERKKDKEKRKEEKREKKEKRKEEKLKKKEKVQAEAESPFVPKLTFKFGAGAGSVSVADSPRESPQASPKKDAFPKLTIKSMPRMDSPPRDRSLSPPPSKKKRSKSPSPFGRPLASPAPTSPTVSKKKAKSEKKKKDRSRSPAPSPPLTPNPQAATSGYPSPMFHTSPAYLSDASDRSPVHIPSIPSTPSPVHIPSVPSTPRRSTSRSRSRSRSPWRRRPSTPSPPRRSPSPVRRKPSPHRRSPSPLKDRSRSPAPSGSTPSPKKKGRPKGATNKVYPREPISLTRQISREAARASKEAARAEKIRMAESQVSHKTKEEGVSHKTKEEGMAHKTKEEAIAAEKARDERIQREREEKRQRLREAQEEKEKAKAAKEGKESAKSAKESAKASKESSKAAKESKAARKEAEKEAAKAAKREAAREAEKEAAREAEKAAKAAKKKEESGLIVETQGKIYDAEGNTIWICPRCKAQDDGSPMIGCDVCDDWYHWDCMGITEEPPEDESWYCPRCDRDKNEAANSSFESKKRGRGGGRGRGRGRGGGRGRKKL